MDSDAADNRIGAHIARVPPAPPVLSPSREKQPFMGETGNTTEPRRTCMSRSANGRATIRCAAFVMASALPLVAHVAEPSVRVVWAKQSPIFWRDAMRQAAVVSQDGGNPVMGPDGSLWTYGDTFLGTIDENGKPRFSGGVTNTAMLVRQTGQGPKAEYLIDVQGKARHLVPLEPPENWEQHRIWPGGGIYANHRYYVFYELIALTGKGLGFESTGQIGMVRSRDLSQNHHSQPGRTGDTEAMIGSGIGSKDSWRQWERVRLPKPLPFTGMPHSIVRDSHGFLYLYFLKLKGVPGDVPEDRIGELLADKKLREKITSDVFAARVREEDIENPDRYEFLQGMVADRVYGQVSVAWNEYLGRYVMCQVGTPFDHPREIFIRLSAGPEGPFGEMVRVFALPPRPIGERLKGLVYCAFLHPLLFKDQGKHMALTFCEIQDVGEGIPDLVEFEVERVDGRPALAPE